MDHSEQASQKPQAAGLAALIGAWAVPAVIALAGFFVAYQFVDPAPPNRITLATGQAGGAYQAFGERYKEHLARHGIVVELRESAGTQQNLQWLAEPQSGVDVAFVQGGVGRAEQYPTLVSLASLYLEPLWAIGNLSFEGLRFDALEGQVVAPGAPGSGTRVLVEDLLADNGLGLENLTLSTAAGQAGLRQIEAGELDLMLFTGAPDATLLQDVLASDSVKILSLERAPALARRHPFLKHLSLPQGVLSLQRDRPASSVELVAPTANLVTTQDFHPALVDLLLRTADEIHSPPSLLADANVFPSAVNLAFPLSPEAQRYFRSGPSLLQRFLPFWAATLIDRLVVMLVPLIALLVPLAKTMPPLYRWRVRRRIYRWYDALDNIDKQLQPGVLCANAAELRGRLDEIETEVKQVVTPLSYADKLYDLRQHLDLVRSKVNRAAPPDVPD